MPLEVSDEELMARFRDGEPTAFDLLLDRHKRGVFAYLLRSAPSRADAEDLFQEVFLRVVGAAPRWEAQAKVTTWVYTIARNVAIDAARRRATRPAAIALESPPGEPGLAPIDVLASSGPAADQTLLRREHERAIEALVRDLPDEQREAFLLKREGLTFEQIALVTETPRNTVKSRLRYALEKLRLGLAAAGLLDRMPMDDQR